MVHFIESPEMPDVSPRFPFLCLLVSGGHTQLVVVRDHHNMEIIGRTIDDAAGEAFDKCAKLMGLPYPGGPYVDRLAREGDPVRFRFNKPRIAGFDYSFSGLKTSFLYFLRDQLKLDPDFVDKNKADLAASLQLTIIDILLHKLRSAMKHTGIDQVALAGGVSANSGLRSAMERESAKHGWDLFIPPLSYTTDNAAMIAITGYYRFLEGRFASDDIAPLARMYF
jgi:N6-L-threonylcarbamoyladenine synthase